MILSHEKNCSNSTFFQLTSESLVSKMATDLRQIKKTLDFKQTKKDRMNLDIYLDAGEGHRGFAFTAFGGGVHLLGDVVGKLKAVAFQPFFQTLEGRSVDVAK